ncbi:unnamed protein product [marine sediment metagenome]|uniref:Aldehyde oxidase/xanthine dehydrogenase a/b hammerhead domain-containing protein n=1 Tax=marine sediment metagenome TaxID=412755 RepID=X1ABX8_9ZZZZ
MEEGVEKMPKKYVGKNILKVDAQEKVMGKAIYPDDIYFDDMLYLKIKRATHPHAYLRRIDIIYIVRTGTVIHPFMNYC